MAVPGSVRSPASEGTNLLLVDGAPPAVRCARRARGVGARGAPGPPGSARSAAAARAGGPHAARALRAMGRPDAGRSSSCARVGPLPEVAVASGRLEAGGWLSRSGAGGSKRSVAEGPRDERSVRSARCRWCCAEFAGSLTSLSASTLAAYRSDLDGFVAWAGRAGVEGPWRGRPCAAPSVPGPPDHAGRCRGAWPARRPCCAATSAGSGAWRSRRIRPSRCGRRVAREPGPGADRPGAGGAAGRAAGPDRGRTPSSDGCGTTPCSRSCTGADCGWGSCAGSTLPDVALRTPTPDGVGKGRQAAPGAVGPASRGKTCGRLAAPNAPAFLAAAGPDRRAAAAPAGGRRLPQPAAANGSTPWDVRRILGPQRAVVPTHPHALRHSYATHLLDGVPTSGSSRSSWATPTWRPRRSTPTSARSGSSRSTARPTPA